MGERVVEQKEKDLLPALGFFKDWSNFMLVTTVAALGWTAKVDTSAGCRGLQSASIVCFALSIAFAVFTLALVPLIAEQIKGAKSIYAVEVEFNVLWLWYPSPRPCKLKYVCWPQHFLFLVGIFFYTAWSFAR